MAALYGARAAQISPLEALEDVRRALPEVRPNPLFMRLLGETEAASEALPGGGTHEGVQCQSLPLP